MKLESTFLSETLHSALLDKDQFSLFLSKNINQILADKPNGSWWKIFARELDSFLAQGNLADSIKQVLLLKLARVLPEQPDFRNLCMIYVGLQCSNGNAVSLLSALNSLLSERAFQFEAKKWHRYLCLGYISQPDVPLDNDRLGHDLYLVCRDSLFNGMEVKKFTDSQVRQLLTRLIRPFEHSLWHWIERVLLIQMWADPVYIKTCQNERKHQELIKLILFALSNVDVTFKFNVSLCGYFFEAVSLYLDHWNASIRVSSLFLAQEISKHFDSGNALDFHIEKDPLMKEWLSSTVKEAPTRKAGEDSDDEEEDASTIDRNNKVNPINEYNSIDPAELFDPLPSELGEDPRMPDEKPPIYIREAIQILKSSNDNGNSDLWRRKEATIRSLPTLIRNTDQYSLNDCALALAKALLHFDVGSLDDDTHPNSTINSESRNESMSLLLCRCPELVSPFLYQEFFSDRVNLGQRLLLMGSWIPRCLELISQDIVMVGGRQPLRVSSSQNQSGQILRQSASLSSTRNGGGKSLFQNPFNNRIHHLSIPLFNSLLFDPKNWALLTTKSTLLKKLSLGTLLKLCQGATGTIHESRIAGHLEELFTTYKFSLEHELQQSTSRIE